MKGYYKTAGLHVLCGHFGKSRQAFYDTRNRKEQRLLEASVIVDLVKKEREIARRVGGRKLHKILKVKLCSHGIDLGRDKFHDILRSNDLLVIRKRRRHCTTDSRHRLRKYPNIAKDLVVQQAEQLWVSDITYIRVADRFCYLILITDAYSRKVMGYDFSTHLKASFCVNALEMAIGNRLFLARSLMHHSDRGIQYCSSSYVELLLENDIAISMTQSGDPLENALAERMNGIFKDNFDLARTFQHYEEAKTAITQSIHYYNTRLPHSSCDMLTPEKAHLKQGKLKKHWKSYTERNKLKGQHKGLNPTILSKG